MNRTITAGALLVGLGIAFAAGWGMGARQVSSEMRPNDLAASVRESLGLGGRLERLSRLTSLLQHLDRSNVGEVNDVYRSLLSGLGECDIRPFADAWSEIDGSDAIDGIRQWQSSGKRLFGLNAAIHGWALRDSVAARMTADQLIEDEPAIASKISDALISGWAHSGDPGLARYISEFTNGFMRDRALTIAVGAHLRKGGVDTALAWSEAALVDADENFRRAVFQHTVRAVGRREPERAARWVLDRRAELYAADGARLVAEQWATQDGPTALAWVDREVSGEQRRKAVRGAFARWLASDRTEAVAWLSSQPLRAFHDPALSVYARKLADRSPEDAVGWAGRIQDEAFRLKALKFVARRWYRRDAVAAENWLKSSPLDEEARQAARRPIGQHRQKPRPNAARDLEP